MARVLALLLAATLLAAGRPGHASPSSAEIFWRAVLPDSAVPDAVRNAVTFNYNDYKLLALVPGAGGARAAASRARADSPFLYNYKAPSERLERTEARHHSPFSYNYKAPGGGAASTEEGERAATATATVFFHEQAVRVAEILTFHFPPAAPAALGFLTRRAADSIPFSTPALPGVLAMLGVPPDSDQAAAMAETLRTCESPTTSGEVTFCATSLEALVERAMAALGTRDIRAVTSTLPRGGAPLQRYTVRAVRPVEGSSFVACHDEAYPYTVYRCHGTGPARAYMVEIEGGRGGDTVTMATVCHSDTSLWNPEHMSFKLLGTKPGGEPICHLMPYGHILWAKNVKISPA